MRRIVRTASPDGQVAIGRRDALARLGLAAFGVGVGLNLLGATGCEPQPDLPAIDHLGQGAHGGNHNAVVAARVQAASPSYPYCFAILADAHLPTGAAVFSALREQLLQLEPRPVFAMMVGDFTDLGTLPELQSYLAMIDAFPIPFFSAIGNHEMWAPTAMTRKNFQSVFGPENFSFAYGKCRFVALNDIIPRRNGLTDRQIDWLEEQVADPAHPDRFVFMHASPPCLPPPWGAPPFQNDKRFYEITRAFEVRLVASGHVHELRYKVIDGVTYLVTGGAGGNQDPLLLDPSGQGIFHHFVVATIAADGQSKLEVHRLGQRGPDPDYIIPLPTSVV